MLRDVRSNVTDGLLGFATATGDGLHIKIGVSPSVTEKPITILGSMGASTIQVQAGPVPAGRCGHGRGAGRRGPRVLHPRRREHRWHDRRGHEDGRRPGGSVTVAGLAQSTPTRHRALHRAGRVNTAAFVYSIDGDNFSDEITVPVTGSYEIEGTGLTIKFAEASSPDQKPSSSSCATPTPSRPLHRA